MFLNKKGALESVKEMSLILIAAIIIMLILIYTFSPFISSVTGDFGCKFNVLLARSLKVPVIGTSSFSDLKLCKSTTNVIDKKDIEEVKQILADDMYDCWNMFWKGKVDFVSNWDWGKKNSRCFICDIERFKNYQGDLTAKEFYEFLNTKKSPDGDTYTESFTGVKNARILIDKEDKYNINENEPLYVIFEVEKYFTSGKGMWEAIEKSGWITLVSGITAGAGGAIVCGTIAGVFTAGVGAVPAAFFCFKAGMIAGTSAGFISTFGYSNNLYPSIFVESGKGVEEKCDILS